MKNWKKAIALVASAAALVSVAACGSSNAGGSSDSGKKTVGFVAVGPEGGFRTANEKDIQKAFEDAGFDLTYSPTQNNDQQKQIQKARHIPGLLAMLRLTILRLRSVLLWKVREQAVGMQYL